ncbi:L,D-transpeptidase [Saccharopolyspora terrae]|uniref:L,D-transpeptidase n=1 Tax=Saccharopolyspora terrae TaxID=2530384 RepID=UPI001F1A48B5|nr:Ig-like domain-containing protein [Saccharopolyspora terrae]
MTTSVPDRTTSLSPSEPLELTAQRGVLTSVNVTANGAPVPGKIDRSGHKWTIDSPLAFGTTYQVHAVAHDQDGVPSIPLNSSFTTATPTDIVNVERTRPTDGDTVGIAMPVSIYFDKPVKDRAAVERRLKIETSVPTEGSFNWYSDDQVNWRPKDYWKAGTQVKVRADLYGIDTGAGVMGDKNFESNFTIGRDQRSVGDVNAHTFTVYQDGQEIRKMDASYGRPAYPTQHGIHVATERHDSVRMNSWSWGGPAQGSPGAYDEVLPNAVRISNNGEYVHTNTASTGAQGSSNVTHGCVNLSSTDGRWFLEFTQIGDPVEIVGSTKPLTPADGDIWDWTVPWEEYVKGSALFHSP